MTHILDSALLGLMEQSGMAVATLVEGLEQEELLRSRLTRAEVLRQLQRLAASAAQVEPSLRADMPELDWSGWEALRARFAAPAGAAPSVRANAATSARMPAFPVIARLIG